MVYEGRVSLGLASDSFGGRLVSVLDPMGISAIEISNIRRCEVRLIKLEGKMSRVHLTCEKDGTDFIHSTVNTSNLKAHSLISSDKIQLIENGKYGVLSTEIN